MSIKVTFVDNARDAVIGQSEIPADQLPETFALSTNLSIAGKDWHVQRAEPITRAEYVATGTLRLWLHEIQYVDPKTILFSLCTLEDRQPPLVEGDLGGAYRMHEDDWRQRELVKGDAFEIEITAEFDAIVSAQATRKGAGFQHLHVRSKIPAPLGDAVIALADLERDLGNPPRRPVAIGPLLVDGGFAFALGDETVYGHAVDGLVTTIGTTGDLVPPLAEVARRNNLVLVDWCAPAVLRPEARGFIQ